MSDDTGPESDLISISADYCRYRLALTTLGIAPGIDWVWTLCLAAVGFLSFLLSGIDKVTIVVGPFFILGSCLSILRQNGRLPFDVEVPILVILSGFLLLLASLPIIPVPNGSFLNPNRKIRVSIVMDDHDEMIGPLRITMRRYAACLDFGWHDVSIRDEHGAILHGAIVVNT